MLSRNGSCSKWVVAAWILSAVFSITGLAQGRSTTSSDRARLDPLKEALGLSGSLRLGYWSATRNLDGKRPIGSAMLWAKTKRDLSSRLSAYGEAWLASRGPVDRGEIRGELREAYLNLKLDHLDVRAGRQIFAWGRADAINPTANLSGEDLTLLTPDSEDRKFGTTALRSRYFLPHSLSVSGIWLPEFRSTRFPFPDIGSGSSFIQDSPHWPANQFAVRLDKSGGAVDWSCSYFDGFDLLPDLSVANDSSVSEQIKVSHHRLRVIGADGATNFGHYALRAEGAYAFTQNTSGQDPFVKEPYLFAIVGGDRTYGGELNINVQYIFRFVSELPPTPSGEDGFARRVAQEEAIIGSQTRGTQHGASARISDKWLHETLEAEIGIVGYFDPKGVLVRPKVTYSFTDHWKAIVGSEVYRGSNQSVFGLLRQNSVGYLEARFSF